MKEKLYYSVPNNEMLLRYLLDKVRQLSDLTMSQRQIIAKLIEEMGELKLSRGKK